MNEQIVVHTNDGLMPILDSHTFVAQLAAFQEIVKSYLVPGVDYGKIPGTDKDTLFKPGAEKLCEIYGFYADCIVENVVEDWNREPPLFDYTVKCTIHRRKDNAIIATGLGSCNSYESKYKWRMGKRKCLHCNEPAIIAGKKEWGGGWICHKKQGGCGAKFTDNDPGIINQPLGRIPNDDIASQKNTVLKMAQKRAIVAATIASTRSSGIFTQDVEDFIDTAVSETEPDKPPPPPPDDPAPAAHAVKVMEEIEPPKPVRKDAAVSAAELTHLMNIYKEKGWQRFDILEVILQTCRPERITLSNMGTNFTHALLARVVAELDKLQPPVKQPKEKNVA